MSTRNDRRTVFGWALYDWANSAYATASGAIVAPFFTGVIVPEEGYGGMSGETLWSMLVSFGTFILFLAMPVLGAIADSTDAKRAFLRVFAWSGAAVTVLVPWAPVGAVPLFLGLFLISQIGFTAANVFYDGFLPEITSSGTIDRVSARGFAFGYAGGGVFLVLALILIVSSDGILGMSQDTATRLAIAGAGVWWMAFSFPALRRLPPPTGGGGPEVRPRVWVVRHYAKVGFARTLATTRKLRRFPQLMLFVVAFVVYIDGTQTVINVSGAYAEDTLNLETQEIIIGFLVVQFVAFFGALWFGWLSDRIGPKRAILVGLAMWIVVAVAAYFLPSGDALPFYGLAVLVGTVLGGVSALSRSLYGSMIPEEGSAEFFGFFTVFSKFSAIWGPLIFAIVSGSTGSGRPAILSIVAFFVVGGLLLSRLDLNAARAEKARWQEVLGG